MSIKMLEVFTCDFEECPNVHRFGVLPEGWVWAAWRREVLDAENKPQKKATEHHFCGEAHLKAWKKTVGARDSEVQSSIDAVKVG